MTIPVTQTNPQSPAAVGEAIDEEELLAVLEQEIDLENRPDADGDFS